MPRIFDNIDQQLLPALRETLELSTRSDFCVGYFNPRGWRQIDSYIDQWTGGENHCCRLLIGMPKRPQDELLRALSLSGQDGNIDNQTAVRIKKKLAEELREQLAKLAPVLRGSGRP
ncbi:MAG: hypothetical protein HY695_08715 [Deltaproteobacteria bacterium]|nr:hypothetical protein [Deltaproteobacteria bacterium]